MKTEKNILVAFLLNLGFSLFEFFGGWYTGSVAIWSDALHDLGDAASIGVSWALERKSRRAANQSYTFGYARYSVLGSVVTTLILIFGSLAVVVGALRRIAAPTPINYDGMILFALVGASVNVAAAFVTREGDSLNQRAVNLHMLEDALGWTAVLVGAVVMRFTDFALLDPLLSLGLSVFILVHAAKTLSSALDVFLEKAPQGIDAEELCAHLREIGDVSDVHHLHIWTLDGQTCCATLHVVTEGDAQAVKASVREEFREHGISHATLELEREGETCCARTCRIEAAHSHGHHHHHHHH